MAALTRHEESLVRMVLIGLEHDAAELVAGRTSAAELSAATDLRVQMLRSALLEQAVAA